MVRKLDKIEKEMGYCEIKLEKERRLRRQVGFLRADLGALDHVLQAAEPEAPSFGSLPFSKIGRQISQERQASDGQGPFFRRARDSFVSAGVLDMVRQEREILRREKNDIEAKFESFAGFTKKRETLAEEKREALQNVEPQVSARVRRLNDTFKKTEHLWNSLTEDAMNIDEALFFLSRHTDYLSSARSFLISAKGSFDVESWVEGGYCGNLFRHSNVGRSKEMVDGANRNLKLAQKELVCVANVNIGIERFEPVLGEFLEALFDDIFVEGRLDRSISIVERAASTGERYLRNVRRRREQLHKKLHRAERTRVTLFQQLGGERRGRAAVS